MDTHPLHELGSKARVLLSSVFGPYAQDDTFGSRKINPMELYHNQVTRTQGVFSLRMFHHTFGLQMIQANIDAPCTLLDFPDLDRFITEIKKKKYDIVGIGAIIPNVGKVKKMCELIRTHLPKAVIVVGGHIANLAGLDEIIEADYIVKGDGVRWFRKFLGSDVKAPIRHPAVYSAATTRIAGHTLKDKKGDTAAIVIPSAGCPMGCNFCSTSALFGGKGKYINFYETGDELFSIMAQLEKKLETESFFILDENFLLHRKRAIRLLELMEEQGKSWSLYVFSSARVLKSYTIKQLVGLGISWVWMGLEGQDSQYSKLNGVDTHELVDFLLSHGIRVLGSSIIGLENHTPRNIEQIIDYAVSHNTVFHQFMLYTANPGTPLYEELKNNGTLLSENDLPLADAHGQFRFNHNHPHFSDHREEQLILDAFNRDFEVNGPSLYRLINTMLQGWLRYKNHPDQRIRTRYAREIKPLRSTYAGAVWAMTKWYRNDKTMAQKAETLLRELYKTFGIVTRIVTPFIGRFILSAMKREEKRLAKGWRIEPATSYLKQIDFVVAENSVLENNHETAPSLSIESPVEHALI